MPGPNKSYGSPLKQPLRTLLILLTLCPWSGGLAEDCSGPFFRPTRLANPKKWGELSPAQPHAELHYRIVFTPPIHISARAQMRRSIIEWLNSQKVDYAFPEPLDQKTGFVLYLKGPAQRLQEIVAGLERQFSVASVKMVEFLESRKDLIGGAQIARITPKLMGVLDSARGDRTPLLVEIKLAGYAYRVDSSGRSDGEVFEQFRREYNILLSALQEMGYPSERLPTWQSMHRTGSDTLVVTLKSSQIIQLLQAAAGDITLLDLFLYPTPTTNEPPSSSDRDEIYRVFL